MSKTTAAKQVVINGPGIVSIERNPIPLVKPNEVLVKTSYSLLSNGTERTIFSGSYSRNSHWEQWIRYPFTPGYASVGTIVDIGPGVDKAYMGTRVALRAPHSTHHVRPIDRCVPIPHDIPMEDAVWFALARIALLGVWSARLDSHAVALVVGGGPIAQLATRWLSVDGLKTIGLLAPAELAHRAARGGGASAILPGLSHDYTRSSILRALSYPPDAILDCTADPSVLGWALEVVSEYGKVILLGDPGAPEARTLNSDILLKGISVIGTHDRLTYGRWSEGQAAGHFFKLLSESRFSVAAIYTREADIDDAASLYSLLLTNRRDQIGLRIRYS
jgi:threonine dehydrogenase-like Zn-dependent dehydrogenase